MSRNIGQLRRLTLAVAIVALAPVTLLVHNMPAAAGQRADPESWLQTVKREASAKGISQRTIEKALADWEPLPRVIELDRRQPEFTQTFWSYLDRAVSDERVRRGRELMVVHKKLLARIERQYGVQGRFLIAIWGLETNYGANSGGFPVIDALATLAYDERRSAFFRSQLFDALTILDEGHVAPDHMIGSWAGAMGQVQFMPETFRRHAVDQDGDGRQDIWFSLPDALASAANFLRALGWRGDKTWGREVRLPADFDWNLAELGTRKPLAEWQALGVRTAQGHALPPVAIEASVILPGGFKGPAFLVYDNFRAILEWNRSIFYAMAVGHLSDRIAGKGQLLSSRPSEERPLSREEVIEMQRILQANGLDVGAADGVVGSRTRRALRDFQRRNNLPPDGYPTARLLERLRSSETR